MGNGVRLRREELGITQKALAESVGLSRQSLNAIEAGRAVPSVAIALRLARCLGSDVEGLFAGSASELVEAELVGPARPEGSRVIAGFVRERWVAHALAPQCFAPTQYAADGFVRKPLRAGRVSLEVARSPSDLRDNVLVGGCAPGLSVLADRLNNARGPGRFRWLAQSNTGALKALSHGHVHLAGVHLAKESGERLAHSLARFLPTERADVYALATWEAGLVVPEGNPKKIRDVGALANPKLRIALRELGSGARQQLDRLLKREGHDPTQLSAHAIEVRSHMDVAHAVALGAADVGFSIRGAALELGLGFVPLVEERFDLVVPSDLADDGRILRMFDTLASTTFRRELDALGYDARLCATKVIEVVAA